MKKQKLFKLYRHQEEGVQAIVSGWVEKTYVNKYHYQKNCNAFLLYDKMGLGKTIQALESLKRLKNEHGCGGPHLIVAPSACLNVWSSPGSDFHKFFSDEFEIRRFVGRKLTIGKTLENMSEKTIVLTTYETLRSAFNVFVGVNVPKGTLTIGQLTRFCEIYGKRNTWATVLSGESLRRQLISDSQEIYKSKKWAIPAFAQKDTPKKTGFLKLIQTEWTALVLDEIHKIKNSGSKSCKAVGFVNARKRLGLTGTPILNNGLDLITITKYGLGLFDADWASYNRNPIAYRLFQQIISLGRDETDVPELNVHSDKRDKEKERVMLPWIDEYAKANYVREKNSAIAIMEQTKGKSSHNALAKIQRLRQICLHPDLPYLYRDNTYKSDRTVDLIPELDTTYVMVLFCLKQKSPFLYFDKQFRTNLCRWVTRSYCNRIIPSTKMWASLFLIQNLRDRKVVLFSTYKLFFQRLMLPWLQSLGIGCIVFCGESREKQRMVEEAFANDNRIRVLLLVKSAGGLGLNLQKSASVICQLDPHYNEALDEQAVHRIYRIGQEKKVIIRKFYMEGSIDEAMHLMQQRKNDQINTWLGKSDGSLSIEAVRLYLKKYDTVK